MSEIAIRVENLGKRYRLGQQVGYKTLRETLFLAYHTPTRIMGNAVRRRRQAQDSLQSSVSSLRSPVSSQSQPSGLPSPVSRQSNYLWALKDVSFEVKQGEAVGIIGRNGSGKSTLLKILSRITAPTEGYAEIHGRIGSLLEVGTGFHPELTGRENIYLNGAILGMKRAEVDHRFDEIVDFAEIEKFLDTPVKRYSSGMYVRLAFAVASHLEPQVLIVDEVLAVGDVSFQRKCLGRMADVTRGGRTVLFVSHNMAAVESLCPKACLLDHGALVMYDDTPTVVKQYLTSLKSAGTRPLGQRIDRQGNGRLRFTDIMFRSADGRPADVVQCGQDVSISVAYDAHGDTLKHVRMAATVYRINGECLLMLDSQIVDADFASVPPVGRFSCLINRLPLTPGQYYLNLYCEVSGAIADWVQQAAYLTVEAGDFFGTGRLPPQSHGGMLVPHSWCVSGLDRNAGEGGAA